MPNKFFIQLVSPWAMQLQLLPILYFGGNPTFQTGYAPDTPYKVSCCPNSWAVPPYSSSFDPYQTAVYPVRSAYPHQNPCTARHVLYTATYAAPPHVILHTLVVQPNSMRLKYTLLPSLLLEAMVAGIMMTMSAGTLLTVYFSTPVAPHLLTVPTYQAPGTSTCSYVSPQW